MRRSARIGAIYRKELLEILRDRRTLTAMVVIPVVLYPLLMLGFLRAAESEQARLMAQRFVVEVPDNLTRDRLGGIIAAVHQHDQTHTQPGDQKPQATFDLCIGATPVEALGDEVQLRVQLSDDSPRLAIEIVYNEVNVRSQTAMAQLSDLLRRFRDLVTRDSLRELLGASRPGRPREVDVDLILHPVEINTVSVATERQRGGWALGQIIPIILVLMTITGSVYPAIDLTAGERERGTLETLMVTPVPTLHLILGKFLVVATVGMITAFLNVASVGATMHFGGLTKSITEQMPVEIPISVLPIILTCMVPFSLLFAAILVAVCSFARTFKEAQNYVMPVILGAMIPAIAVTLPTVRLGGILLVLPVGNMVLLARELFQETATWGQVVVVLLSTTLYAVAAVAVAVRLFGQEAVVFADSGSYKTLLLRRYYRPSAGPTLSQALLLAALLFPASFYAQSLLGDASEGGFLRMLKWLALLQFAGLFVLVPLGVAWYCKLDVAGTFRLRLPPARAWVAALLLGSSSWLLAQTAFSLQARVVPPSEALQQLLRQIETQLAAQPAWLAVLLLAAIPALTEEFLFRGFVLSGLARGLTKWPAIVTAGLIFGVYHFMLDRIPLTALLGIVLGYLCWQSGSILPGILMHLLHNGIAASGLPAHPAVQTWLRLPENVGELPPTGVLAVAALVFVAGLVLAASIRRPPALEPEPVTPHGALPESPAVDQASNGPVSASSSTGTRSEGGANPPTAGV